MFDSEAFFACDFFPKAKDLPFEKNLNQIFFDPRTDNQDYPIHGPNVIRLARAVVGGDLDVPGLLAGTNHEKVKTKNVYHDRYSQIMKALELDVNHPEKTEGFFSIAALYHDIGKAIRRANHPQIGANILRHFDSEQSNFLVQALRLPTEPDETPSKHHRFSLICSITQHHDKFGVVSTGEAALPVFSDILYFTSDKSGLPGILKNVTSVMILNLADIAAVTTAGEDDRKEALRLAKCVRKARTEPDSPESASEPESLVQLLNIAKKPESCLGLRLRKVVDVLTDWKILVDAVENESVLGNRGKLKRLLLHLEQNPARSITRILRLLKESIETARAEPLAEHVSPTSVESVLVGALGSHQFQFFCQQFAAVAKLDYGLNFFKAVLCACVREAIAKAGPKDCKAGNWNTLSADETAILTGLGRKALQGIANHITALFIKVLHGLVTRYSGVLESGGDNARRFGFQLRDLTSDLEIRKVIIDLLCAENNKDHVALTWIADEVSVWSMD